MKLCLVACALLLAFMPGTLSFDCYSCSVATNAGNNITTAGTEQTRFNGGWTTTGDQECTKQGAYFLANPSPTTNCSLESCVFGDFTLYLAFNDTVGVGVISYLVRMCLANTANITGCSSDVQGWIPTFSGLQGASDVTVTGQQCYCNASNCIPEGVTSLPPGVTTIASVNVTQAAKSNAYSHIGNEPIKTLLCCSIIFTLNLMLSR